MLAAGGALALLRTASIIAFAWLVTQVVVRAIAGDDIAAISGLLGALVLVILVRGLVLWLSDAAAARGGAAVIGQLRQALTGAIGRLGPSWLSTRSGTQVTLTIGRGLDALEGYFTAYVPQLILTAVATPLLVGMIFWSDPTSGIIVLITLPLIPIFMMLIGWATQAAQQKQWAALSTLSRGFLDVVDGLSTLKLFGRQHRQTARIRAVSDEYRVHTMKVLRMSFLSGFVLELAASLSVALVAVAIGLRLLNGQLDLSVGLFVLLLAPEAFLPLRNVGAAYHAATEGIEAAQGAFEILDADRASAPQAAPAAAQQDLTRASLTFDDVTIAYDGRPIVAGFSAEARAGALSVLSAPSGSGKSSLIGAALGFTPASGRIAVGAEHDDLVRRSLIAWSGQNPGLIAGTIAANVALGAPAPDADLVAASLREAAAPELEPSTLLAPGGRGLSGGQAQRVAVARALYRMRAERCPVLILDEPTSALDDATEAALIVNLRRVAVEGRTVVVVSHRAPVVEAADHVIPLEVLTSVR